MGLSIVQRAVRRMGGEIAVESVPGKGSTFKIALPGVNP
ncbi:MAG: ATP-binding protein [Bacillota bacterium]